MPFCDIESLGVLGYGSLVLGTASIVCFVFVQAPQIWKNWKRGSADGIAIAFLMCWLSGDVSNLVGAILLEQTVTQKLLAVWFCLADMCLFCQVLYYQYILVWLGKRPAYDVETVSDFDEYSVGNALNEDSGYSSYDAFGKNGKSAAASGNTYGVSSIVSLTQRSATRMGVALLEGTAPARSNYFGPQQMLMNVMLLSGYVQLCYASCDDETSDGEDTSRVRYIVGISIALLSAVMYLLSRMPQLYKNFSRKSTDGLSIIMFIMSILGNFMYGCSIIMSPSERAQWKLTLPFLLGSLGTMCLDITIFCQFLYYGEKKTDGEEDREWMVETGKSDYDAYSSHAEKGRNFDYTVN